MKMNFIVSTSLIISILASCSTGSILHPNVLLIIIDDLRPILGCYGDTYAITPNIDALASQGTIFTKAYAQQALCGPSRTSFLTSRRPDTTKLYDVHSYWRSHAGNFTTLPQYFKEHGYHTVSAGKVFHPGIVSNYSDDQPYSWSETPYHPPTQAYKQAQVCLGSDGGLHTNIYCPVEVNQQPGGSLPDIETTEYATTWLEERAEGRDNRPFFMAVGYHKPHIPLKFPVEYLDFYPINTVPLAPNDELPKDLPSVAWNPWNDLREREDIAALNVSFPYGPIPKVYARYIRQGYYAATTYVDTLFGKLLSTTRRLFPHTIVALIGDHGWSLGEHQEWSKYSNFEVATRVPFIISKLSAKSVLIHSGAFSSGKSLNNSANTLHIAKESFNLNKTTNKKIKFMKKSGFRNGMLLNKIEKKDGKSAFDIVPTKYDGLVELVDLFPTLVDLAGLPYVQSCMGETTNIETCTEGSSLSPLLSVARSQTHDIKSIEISDYRAKKAVFSQYPRPGLNPTIKPDSDQPRTSETHIMGYSMRTRRYRYTTWLKFNNTTYESDWSEILAEELYDHKVDEDENHNVCGKESYKFRKKCLFLQLYQAGDTQDFLIHDIV